MDVGGREELTGSEERQPLIATDREARLLALWGARAPTAATADAVYQTLREAILEGVLQPGARLGEEELAGWFTVSRTPIREALLRLESEQLVERMSRRGLMVRAVTPEEILDLYVVRQAVDGQAARLAAHNARPPEVTHLRWTNDRMREAAASADYARMRELNFEFHETLCRAGGSPLLLFFMRQVHDRIRRFPGTTFSHGQRALEAIDEHEQLTAAIEAGDADRASQLAQEHMDRALKARIAMLGLGKARTAVLPGATPGEPRRSDSG